MHKRISMLMSATLITAGCTGLGADTKAADRPYAAQPRDAIVYPLPGIKIAGERKRNLSFPTLHSLGVCDKKKCQLNVHIQNDCKNPDLDPQALGLYRDIDDFELTYELWAPRDSKLVLLGLREKPDQDNGPDIFRQQSGAGTRTIVASVKNHFKKTRHYLIEIGPAGGQPCAVLDPPVMPDY